MLQEFRPDHFSLIDQTLLRSALDMQAQIREAQEEADALKGQQPPITADSRPMQTSLWFRLTHLIPHA